jgi:hypothetical protein
MFTLPMFMNYCIFQGIVSSPGDAFSGNHDYPLLTIFAPVIAILVQTYVFFKIYNQQAKIMDKQRANSEQTTALLKQSQQSTMLIEIYKNFFENELYKEISIFLANDENKKVPLNTIMIQKAGDNYKPSGIIVKKTNVVREDETAKNYLWLDDCLDDYLGWFEVLFHAIDCNLVEKGIAERLFKYYLSDAMDTQAVKDYISPESQYWHDLKSLCELFEVEFPKP